MRAARPADGGAAARLALAVAAASFSGPILRWAGAHGAGTPAMVLAAGRMLFAFALSLPAALAYARRRGWRAAGLGLDRRVAAPMALATIALALHFAAWTAGVERTSVASAVVLVNAHPLLVLGAEAVLWRRRVSSRRWAGAALALAGVAALAGADGLTLGTGGLAGDALAAAGAATYGVYVLASARVRAQVASPIQVAVLYGGCLAVLAPWAAALGLAWPAPAAAPGAWLAFVLLALIPTALGHSMVQSILDRVAPGVISVALLGEPVGAGLLAWLFLGEPPTPAELAGGLAVLGGIALALWPTGEPTAPALPT
ncbi:MAG: DMT family transporter [Firmicutes bacterium]|nr:DMT family transporter [Bacillota bacterium]